MPRIPYPDPATLSEETRAMIAGTPINIVRMAAYAHPMLQVAQANIAYAFGNPEVIDPYLREVMVLRVAKVENSAYEEHQHRTIALSAGMTPGTIEEILSGNYSNLSPFHAAAARFTDELTEFGNVTDQTLAEVRALTDDSTLVNMVMVVWQYMGVARLIAVTGPDLDVDVLQSLPTSETDRFDDD